MHFMAESSIEALGLDIREKQKAADGSVQGYHQLLTSLRAYEAVLHISNNAGIDQEAANQETLQSICRVVQPPAQLLQLDELDHDDDSIPALRSLCDVFQDITVSCLHIITKHLDHNPPKADEAFTHDLATAIVTFTDSSEPWSNVLTSVSASDTIERHRLLLITDTFLISHLLRSTIKPLFGVHPGTITSEGRKAIRTTRTASTVDDRPWREGRPETLTLLKFAINNLDNTAIEVNWPLVIPPVLKTLDTGDVVSKYRGCQILEALLQNVTPDLLKRTGLGEVLWEAVLPCLHYLPPLTPIRISAKITDAAHNVLIVLARLRFPDEKLTKERAELLGQVLRDGIFQGLVYAGDNVDVEEMFMQNARKLVDEMGIYAVRHLAKLLSMCTTALADPFVTAHRPLILEALCTLRTIMLTCWPRIAQHQVLILRGLVLCWLRVLDEGKDDLEVKRELRNTLKVLKGATLAAGGIHEAVEAVIENNNKSKDLFGGVM